MIDALPSPDVLETWVLPALLGLGLAAAWVLLAWGWPRLARA